MDDVKNQFKGLVKKLNNPFASSSSKFKGEGHRLGNSQQQSSQPNSLQQQADWRKLQQERWEKDRSTPRQDRSKPSAPTLAQSQPSIVPKSACSSAHAPISSLDTSSKLDIGSPDVILSDVAAGRNLDYSGTSDAIILQTGVGSESGLDPSEACETPYLDHASKDAVRTCKVEDLNSCSHANHEGTMNLPEVNGGPSILGVAQTEHSPSFDPFSSQIGSLSSSTNTSNLQMYQCPVCGSWWKSETEVNTHVDECLNQSTSIPSDNMQSMDSKPDNDQIKVSVGVFLSGGPSGDTIDVFLRILRNIVNSPDLEKFRKIRLSNPKIHETVGMALGGVELLEAVGFTHQSEDEEIWAVMDHPSIDRINAMQGVISQLEACIPCIREETNSKEKASVQRKVDRQVRVFHAAPENMAAKMELPNSFFQLSASELRQEAAARKKKLEDSQLLVSRVSRDRIAAANKRRYKAAIIRIQFPDGVVLQGMFLPWEPTTAIYEFVSNSLRDPSTQFTLVAPGPLRRQAIPAVAEGATKVPTLEEANLVPAVLVKFQCADSDAMTFTGLHPDVLVGIEPLSSTALHSQ